MLQQLVPKKGTSRQTSIICCTECTNVDFPKSSADEEGALARWKDAKMGRWIRKERCWGLRELKWWIGGTWS